MEPIQHTPKQEVFKSLSKQEKAIDEQIKSLKGTFLGFLRYRSTLRDLETQKVFIASEKQKLGDLDTSVSKIFSTSRATPLDQRNYIVKKRDKRADAIHTLSKKRFAALRNRGTKARLRHEIKALDNLEQRALFGSKKISSKTFGDLIPTEGNITEKKYLDLVNLVIRTTGNKSLYTMGFLSEVLSVFSATSVNKMTSGDFDKEVNAMWNMLSQTSVAKSFINRVVDRSSQSISIEVQRPYSDRNAEKIISLQLNSCAGFKISDTERLKLIPHQCETYRTNPKAKKQVIEHNITGVIVHEKFHEGKWMETGFGVQAAVNAKWEPETGYQINISP